MENEISDFHRYLDFIREEYINYCIDVYKKADGHNYLSLYEFHKLYNIWKFEQDNLRELDKL